MPKKRGKLSEEEMEFIRGHVDTMTLDQIATSINRHIEPIQKFCAINKLTYEGMSEETYDDTVLKKRLENRPYWKEVKQQFNNDELEYFTITWIRILKQFREDILYTEELQVKQWITLEILSNRVMRDRKKAIEQIDRLETELRRANDIDPAMRSPEENARITVLEMEVSHIRHSLGAFISEHSKLLEKTDSIQKALKMARSDRIRKIEDAKSSWAGLIKAMEEEQIRDRVGQDAEIMHMAKNAAKKRLAANIEFDDNTIDQALLNADTLQEEENE